MESWFEKIALDLRKRNGDRKVTICTGTAVLDPFHVGNMREFFVAEMIRKEVVHQGGQARHIVYLDDLDPLKKLYPHLPQEYERWVGCSLKRIPDPDGCHESYSAHYAAELIDIFRYLGVETDIILSSEQYEGGFYLESTLKVLSYREQIKDIIHSMTGRELSAKDAWFFMPECPSCFSIQKTMVQHWEPGTTRMQISCQCGFSGDIDFSKGGGKLTWRADWPMRLSKLGIDLEPNGPGHTSSGGSFDSSAEICRQVFNSPAPVSLPYAWVCHGKKSKEPGQKNAALVPMRSGNGNAILMKDLMESYPPEIFWWMFARRDPEHEFEFHMDRTLLEEARSIRMSNGDRKILERYFPVCEHLKQIPFDHMATVAQIGGFDPGKIRAILDRSPTYRSVAGIGISEQDLDYIKQWLDKAGGNLKISLASTENAPTELTQLLIRNLEALPAWTADSIHGAVQQTAEQSGVNAKAVFGDCYRKLFGQPHGPKLAFLLESMGKQETLQHLR